VHTINECDRHPGGPPSTTVDLALHLGLGRSSGSRSVLVGLSQCVSIAEARMTQRAGANLPFSTDRHPSSRTEAADLGRTGRSMPTGALHHSRGGAPTASGASLWPISPTERRFGWPDGQCTCRLSVDQGGRRGRQRRLPATAAADRGKKLLGGPLMLVLTHGSVLDPDSPGQVAAMPQDCCSALPTRKGSLVGDRATSPPGTYSVSPPLDYVPQCWTCCPARCLVSTRMII
jgi:hypothetical protein